MLGIRAQVLKSATGSINASQSIASTTQGICGPTASPMFELTGVLSTGFHKLSVPRLIQLHLAASERTMKTATDEDCPQKGFHCNHVQVSAAPSRAIY
ncbi:cysteine protease [Moniliophthora roreri]|nr:cysteine protease [Moniliophthora roreri]